MKIYQYKLEMNQRRKTVLKKEREVVSNEIIKMNSSDEVEEFMNRYFNTNLLSEEYVYVLSFNTKCHLKGVFEISHGTINSSLISSKAVFTRLLLQDAASFIIVHTHPSGESNPSKNDIDITKKLLKAAEILDINFLDHIIIGYKEHYSFLKNGRLF